MRKSCGVKFKRNPDGTQKVTITFNGVTLKADAWGRCWWIVNHKGRTIHHVDCGGIFLQPKVIVKIYCRVPQTRLDALQRKRAYELFRTKSPILKT